jgi:hypothetical protein
MKSTFALLCIAVVLAAFGCDERRSSPVGGDVIDRENQGQFRQVYFRPAARDSVYRTDISLLAGSFLLVGGWNGYLTKTLLKFGDLPDGIQVVSAEVSLVTGDVVDADYPLSFFLDSLRILVTALETEWSGENVTFDTPLSGTPIDTVAVGRADGDTVNFSIPTATVQAWIDSTADNNGFLLSCLEDAGFIKEFYSTNSASGLPTLHLAWALTDTTDSTVSIQSTSDLFVVKRETDWPFDVNPERLMVGNGTAYRSLLYFPVEDSIPDKATIIKAQLTLTVDTTYSFFDDMAIGIYAVTSSSWDNPEFDATQITWITVGAEDDSATFEIHSVIQDWLDGTRANEGLLLKSLYEDKGISSFVFYSSHGGPDDAPRLRVMYAISPDLSPKKVEKDQSRAQ